MSVQSLGPAVLLFFCSVILPLNALDNGLARTPPSKYSNDWYLTHMKVFWSWLFEHSCNGEQVWQIALFLYLKPIIIQLPCMTEITKCSHKGAGFFYFLFLKFKVRTALKKANPDVTILPIRTELIWLIGRLFHDGYN